MRNFPLRPKPIAHGRKFTLISLRMPGPTPFRKELNADGKSALPGHRPKFPLSRYALSVRYGLWPEGNILLRNFPLRPKPIAHGRKFTLISLCMPGPAPSRKEFKAEGTGQSSPMPYLRQRKFLGFPARCRCRALVLSFQAYNAPLARSRVSPGDKPPSGTRVGGPYCTPYSPGVGVSHFSCSNAGQPATFEIQAFAAPTPHRAARPFLCGAAEH